MTRKTKQELFEIVQLMHGNNLIMQKSTCQYTYDSEKQVCNKTI